MSITDQAESDANVARLYEQYYDSCVVGVGYKYRNWYIPDYMMDGLRDWVSHGVRPGSFLWAVITNDFARACAKADEENLANLPAYAAYLRDAMPSACHGSLEKALAWEYEKRSKVKMP